MRQRAEVEAATVIVILEQELQQQEQQQVPDVCNARYC